MKKLDKLDKCYIWHIITEAKLKLMRKELKKICLQEMKNTKTNIEM